MSYPRASTLVLLAMLAACGGSGSETPPPVEPSAADLSTYRPRTMPTSSAPTVLEDEEESPKGSPVEEEETEETSRPVRPSHKRKRPARNPLE